MWERTLQDLVRGLRANKKDEAKFIATAMEEIRKEVRSKDMDLKAGAVLKLTYLQMLGYDMSWASFHVVEAMSSARYDLKCMGYLAAAQSFHEDTDVLMLTHNSLKKDLTSNPMDAAVCLNGITQIMTTDIARDLSKDIITMLSHSRATVRKRAVLALYKVFIKYPEAVEFGSQKFRDKLDDPDPGVVAATVNVLCELARHNPQEYLPLAPQLFHLMTTSSNNWMLIKIIKLFGFLAPHEPRLIKKLLPPITDLISTTPAISLLYECVHTCIIGGLLQGASGHSLAQTCVSKLATFLEDPDQNLKYIALLALVKLVPDYPHLIAEYESRILASVDDQDLSIRMRALDLVSAMVNENNLQSIVQQLLAHLARPDGTQTTAAQALAAASTTKTTTPSPTQSTAYRTTLCKHILDIGSANIYANVTDFEWYISLLVDLAYVSRSPVGPQIQSQVIDVCVRVPQVREYAVQLCMRLLGDDTFIGSEEIDSGREGSGCQEVLLAAAWICGEYASDYADTRKVIPSLFAPTSNFLSAETISVYLQSAAKVFGSWAVDVAQSWDSSYLADLKETVNLVIKGVSEYTGNKNIEIQERAANILQLFRFIQADLGSFKPKPPGEASNGFASEATSSFDPVSVTEPAYPKSLYLLHPLFSGAYSLKPVAAEAQTSVPVPEGLDLDTWIVPEARPVEQLPEPEDRRKRKGKKGKKIVEVDAEGFSDSSSLRKGKGKQPSAEDASERARAKAERLERMRDDPYYIVDDRPARTPNNIDVDSIPVVRLDDIPMPSSATPAQPVERPVTRRAPVSYTIDRGCEMPTGSASSPSSMTPARATTPIPASSVKSVADGADKAASTADSVKVTKVKKKGAKKKRTQDVG